MENLLSANCIANKGDKELIKENVIHVAVFMLLLTGIWIVSGWASYQYISDWVLKVGVIALTWGITLLVLYVVFRKLNWRWWE
jgi:hypothetical protein